MFLDSYVSPLTKKSIISNANKKALANNIKHGKTRKKIDKIVEQAYKAFILGGQCLNRKILSDRYWLNEYQTNQLIEELVELKKIREYKNLDTTKYHKSSQIREAVNNEKDILQENLQRIRKIVDNERICGTKQSSIKEGFVYLIINEVWNDWVKVGMTTDFESRLNSYNVYDPESKFKFVKLSYVDDRRKIESRLIKTMSDMSQLVNGEWFKIDRNQAIEIFEKEITI
jgi:hypothetical protein